MSDTITTAPSPAPPGPDPRRSRLAWRCRRGTKELDLLLRGWLDSSYDAASEAQRECFAALLELPDPLLASHLAGFSRPSDPGLAALVDAIGGIMSRPGAGTFAPAAGPTEGPVSMTGRPRQLP
jgi:antitoxin CptB